MKSAMTSANVSLNSYLSEKIHTVNGWCSPHLWQSIWPLRKLIGSGSVGEIGVFEGKFLIGLIHTFDTECQLKHAALDVFDMQEFNIDKAGVGKAQVLDVNMDRNGIDARNVEKIRVDSLSLCADDAL